MLLNGRRRLLLSLDKNHRSLAVWSLENGYQEAFAALQCNMNNFGKLVFYEAKSEKLCHLVAT